MSHRGIKAKHEREWQRHQYAIGVDDGYHGKQGRYSDQYYQRGFRRGRQRRERDIKRGKL